MRKFSKITAIALSSAFIFSSASGANAADYITKAVEGLKSSNVYIDSKADFPEASAVKSNYEGASVGIVALPEDASAQVSANVLASSISEKTDYDLVIVSIDKENDVYGAFGKNADSSKILETLNSKSTGDASETLSNSYQEIVSALPENTIEADNTPSGPANLLLTAVILFALAGAAASAKIFRNSRNKNSVIQNPKGEVINEVTQFANAYENFVTTIRKNDQIFKNAGVISKIDTILKNTIDLFARIEKRGDQSKKITAAIHYKDVFERLNSALDSDYYPDIYKNNHLWDNPQGRLNEVNQAIDMVNKELVENIKKVNASGDLDIQVDLKMLKSSVNSSTAHKEIYNEAGE